MSNNKTKNSLVLNFVLPCVYSLSIKRKLFFNRLHCRSLRSTSFVRISDHIEVTDKRRETNWTIIVINKSTFRSRMTKMISTFIPIVWRRYEQFIVTSNAKSINIHRSSRDAVCKPSCTKIGKIPNIRHIFIQI